ncbi:MAG: hypothetical protein FWH57_10540, partial [Oscillospiraceae bacterium]|nr:hypothetical protein [Oscillospiraceae bacterium]
MKKFLMVLAFVVLIVAILWILLFHGANFAWGKAPRSSDPLLIEPEEDIRENLFEQTPIGMSMEDALAMIESHEKWELESVNSENGFTYYSKRR